MRFVPTRFEGAWLLEPVRHADNRGWFARTWCHNEFQDHGLPTSFVQCSVSFNVLRGTLRGMHFQSAPHEEAKLVRCTRGVIFDVIVDIRPQSPVYGQWQAFELTADNGHAVYIPGGFAHGFQTLTDNSEVSYQMTEFYHPQSAAGFHHADSSVQIHWPCEVTRISEADQSLPLLNSRRVAA
ncbi:MAG: dTDP-4-dehydrorhamnose 3,5-epimerase [Planctomycetaceae bacterium]